MPNLSATDAASGRWFSFSGRTRRAPFWTWTLVLVVLVALSLALQLIPSDGDGMMWARAGGALVAIIAIVTCVPSVRFAVRRLHDANLSGWFVLIGGIPLIGIPLLLTITLLPSNPRGARFDVRRGAASRGAQPAATRAAAGTARPRAGIPSTPRDRSRH